MSDPTNAPPQALTPTATYGSVIDRLDVTTVIFRLARAMDTRDWPLLATCFTPDVLGVFATGPVQGIDAVRRQYQAFLTPLDVTQHLITNTEVTLAGDTATATSYFHAQHTRALDDGRRPLRHRRPVPRRPDPHERRVADHSSDRDRVLDRWRPAGGRQHPAAPTGPTRRTAELVTATRLTSHRRRRLITAGARRTSNMTRPEIGAGPDRRPRPTSP